MKKTILFHIGMPKSGSTTIQTFLDRNARALADRRVVFPPVPYMYPGVSQLRNGAYLSKHVHYGDGTLNEGEEKRRRKEQNERMVSFLEQDYDMVILSDEGYWSYLCLEDALYGELADWNRQLAEHGITLKIILYLRRQDDFYESWWRQRVKDGAKVEMWQTMLEQQMEPPLDYYERIRRLGDIVGKENLAIRKLDPAELYKGNLAWDFLHAAGIKIKIKGKKGFHKPNDRNNPAYSNEYVDLKQLLNFIDHSDGYGRFSEESNFFRKTVRLCDLNFPGNRSHLFSAEESRRFMERFAEGNRKIHEEYMGGSGDLFPLDLPERRTWNRDPSARLDAAVRVFGEIIYDQEKRLLEQEKKIAALEKRIERQKGEQAKQQNETGRLRRQMDTLLFPLLPARILLKKWKDRKKEQEIIEVEATDAPEQLELKDQAETETEEEGIE